MNKNHCFATWDRVLVMIWRLEVTLEGLEAVGRIGKAFALESPSPISVLVIVESTSPPPGDKVRGPMAAFHREMAPSVKEQIVIAEGSGFRSALVRSIGVALSAIAPNRLPFRFAGSVEEAAMLIKPHLTPRAGGAEGLQAAVKQLRDQLR